MGARRTTRALAAAAACLLLAGPASAQSGKDKPQSESDQDKSKPAGGRWYGGARRFAGDDRSNRSRSQRLEPAFARGYGDGYSSGLADGRGRDRYDPVRHKDYKQGDQGYSNTYGSRDAYRNNYRAGFRQGYEDGYRTTTR